MRRHVPFWGWLLLIVVTLYAIYNPLGFCVLGLWLLGDEVALPVKLLVTAIPVALLGTLCLRNMAFHRTCRYRHSRHPFGPHALGARLLRYLRSGGCGSLELDGAATPRAHPGSGVPMVADLARCDRSGECR